MTAVSLGNLIESAGPTALMVSRWITNAAFSNGGLPVPSINRAPINAAVCPPSWAFDIPVALENSPSEKYRGNRQILRRIRCQFGKLNPTNRGRLYSEVLENLISIDEKCSNNCRFIEDLSRTPPQVS